MNKRKLIEIEARENYGKVLAYTKVSIAKNHHEAEDLVSEAYLKFFDSLDRGKNKYEPNTNFVNYLMFIVKNIAIDSVGRFGGAGVGAKIGSFFLPPFGTLVGGGLGYIFGGELANSFKLEWSCEKEINDVQIRYPNPCP